MSTSLPNIAGSVFQFDDYFLQQGLVASRKSERKRIVLPVHRSQDALVQRIVNFLQPGTYIRPHRHSRTHATETIIIERGAISVLIWDDSGNLKQTLWMKAQSSGNMIDIEPHIWHSMIVWQPDTILFEFKRGPYSVDADKEFADWSPEENSVESSTFLRNLEQIYALERELIRERISKKKTICFQKGATGQF